MANTANAVVVPGVGQAFLPDLREEPRTGSLVARAVLTHTLTLAILVALSTSAVRAAPPAIPPPDSPLRLLDLRWLARPAVHEPFFVDTEITPPEPTGADPALLAEIAGPGVLRYLSIGPVKRLVIQLDGQAIYDGGGENWRNTVHEAWKNGRGDAPWAWPLVQRNAISLDCAVPIPFAGTLRVLASDPAAHLYMAGVRLAQPPTYNFQGPRWKAELATALAFLGITHTGASDAPPVESWQGIYPLPDGKAITRETAVNPGRRATLLSIEGAGEIIGIRFEFHLPFFNRLRDLAIEITPDNAPAPTIRMPLVDMLGDMQPFFELWNLTHGTWVSGVQMPGSHEPWMTGWFRLPIPYANGLRMDVINRHPDLPQQVCARFQLAPGTPGTDLRLCGGRRTVDLPQTAAEEIELLTFSKSGRLVSLTLFSTGHAYVGEWLRGMRVSLNDADGTVLACGRAFLPLGCGPYFQKPLNLVWSQPRCDVTAWLAAHRDFWVDPRPLPPGSSVRYRSGGKSSPTVGEVAALWYQQLPYGAPEIAARARTLPELHLQPLPARAPGGVAVEAEDLLPRAVASAGDVYVERQLARDARASGDALLAWNAPAMGEYLDLFVVTPPTPYVQLWIRAPGVPGGGRFAVLLRPAEQAHAAPLWKPGADDFARRSRGEVQADYLLNCFEKFPLQRRQSHYPTAYPRNPAPGNLARLRFVAASPSHHLLTADQITLNPAPPLPPGWHTLYDALPLASAGAEAGPMESGRADFHGCGGLRLAAAGPAIFRILLATPVPARVDDMPVLRGRVARGVWTAGIADEDRALGEPGTTTDWPLGTVAAGTAMLELTLSTTGGELLLNAWRLSPGEHE